MKIIFDYLILVCFFVFSSLGSAMAQKSVHIKKQTNKIQSQEKNCSQDGEVWKKIDIKGFSVCLPDEFILKNIVSDLNFWKYQTDKLQLEIYTGSRLPQVSSIEKKFPTYSEKLVVNNNIQINVISYEYEVKHNPFKYVKIAQYLKKGELKDLKMLIYIATKDNDDSKKEVINKIFFSAGLSNN